VRRAHPTQLGVDVLEIRQGILKAIEEKFQNKSVNID